jgi:hypothetical protein
LRGLAMDDKRIQDLVKMAMEIEALERAGDRPAIGFRAGAIRRLMVNAGMGLAAAACLVVALFVMHGRQQQPIPKLATGPKAPAAVDRPATSSPVVGTADEKGCVVMAMYRDTDGRCTCVQMEQPEWCGQRRLTDVSRSELRQAALREPCTNDAQQVVILAVEGRTDSLPRNHDEAEVIAQQLSTAAASIGRHTDVTAFAYAAMPRLTSDSTVVAETLSMRQATRGLRPDSPATWK